MSALSKYDLNAENVLLLSDDDDLNKSNEVEALLVQDQPKYHEDVASSADSSFSYDSTYGSASVSPDSSFPVGCVSTTLPSSSFMVRSTLK
ncbi:hypothetical protein H2198_007596 [Neophaeococcomyces mojaviensis]|uniref:Uncharacterized protein n=1 Tax=Neophaeococcomyces mojaviensis TaxID=3383035 RepID=A0ACC2ZZY9_9EURO|nr:hypothetical protein H2198_007596 [Knufia sp. JES_112]